MFKGCNSLWALAFPMMLVEGIAAQPADLSEIKPRPELWDQDSLVSTIRHAYERLEEYARLSGARLSFELSDFRTIHRQDLDTIYWVDVETLESGDVVHISRRSNGDTGDVEYLPRWYVSPRELSLEQRKGVATVTYGRVLEHSDPSELDRLAALTSYGVRVTLEGHSRDYRAAFLWLRGSTGELGQIRVQDHITQGVARALTDRAEPRARPATVAVEPLASSPQAEDGRGGTNGEPGTPILIDLDGGGFSLTGLEDPVWFDVDADGEAEKMGWTVAESGDGFLVLDRNGNGLIDDGQELFGDANAEIAGDQVIGGGLNNGYAALATFDIDWMGGNFDGVIDARDDVFSSLRVWVDESHDGISDPEELRSLESCGITAIELAYRRSRGRDSHGNEFRYFSFVHFDDNTKSRSVDVYFVTGSDDS